MTTIIAAASGFLTAIVVLVVERTAHRYEITKAERAAYFRGYKDATAFQSANQTKPTKPTNQTNNE